MIIGIDVGKDSATICGAQTRPSKVKEFCRQPDNFRFLTNLSLTKFEGLFEGVKIELAILEPTGGHYSRYWFHGLTRAGIEVLFVGHDALKSYRKYLGLPGKDDRSDSLALLCYGFDYRNDLSRFVTIKHPSTEKMRQLWLRLRFYTRRRVAAINLLRQALSSEFPWLGKISFSREVHKPIPRPIRWLACKEVVDNYDNMLEDSTGLGISVETAQLAQAIFDDFSQEQRLESQIQQLLDLPLFESYLQVFQEFGFGLKISAFLLPQVYPIDQFLRADGKPIIERVKNSSGKYSKLRISERRFSARVGGVTRSRHQSGDSEKYQKSGNRIARMVLWQWFRCRIEIKRNRPKSDVAEQIAAWWDAGKSEGVPIKKLRTRCCAKASILLFRRLVCECT